MAKKDTIEAKISPRGYLFTEMGNPIRDGIEFGVGLLLVYITWKGLALIFKSLF